MQNLFSRISNANPSFARHFRLVLLIGYGLLMKSFANFLLTSIILDIIRNQYLQNTFQYSQTTIQINNVNFFLLLENSLPDKKQKANYHELNSLKIKSRFLEQ